MAPATLMRRRVSALPLPLVALLLSALLLALPSCRDKSAADQSVAVTIAGQQFHLELALDAQARLQGLSDRKSVAADGGMLFVFPEPRLQYFVMRRCLIPIDIAFLDPAGRIVAMHAMTIVPYDTPEGELPRYSSQWPAQFAIELTGGSLARLGLKINDKIDLPADVLRKLAH